MPGCFTKGCATLRSHQQRVSVPISLHPHQHLSASWVRAIFMVLICIIPTELIMLSIFSWSYWPLVYILWETVYSNLLLIFQLDCLFLMEVLSIFTYTRYRFLTRHVICNELLPSMNYLFTLFFFCCISFFN